MLQELRPCQCAHCPVLTVSVPKDCKSQHVSPSLPSLILYLYLVEVWRFKKYVWTVFPKLKELCKRAVFSPLSGAWSVVFTHFLALTAGKIGNYTAVCVCLNLFGFPNFKQLLSHVLPVLQQGTQQKRVSSLSLTWVSSCFFIYSLKHTFSVIYPINKNERHQYWTKLSQLFPKTMERTCLSILVEQVPSEIVAKKCRTCF